MPRTPRRHLPLFVERSVAATEMHRTDLSAKFELKVRQEVSDRGESITCTPGCASCCYHPVMISILEGISIYRYLQKKGRWTDKLKAKLKETSDLQYGTSFEVWLFSMIPCPLLDGKNRCTAYEARPFICRSYYATSDPYNCHPHRLGDKTKLVDRRDVVDEFHNRQAKALAQHNLHFLSMPIGKALLLAERICVGEIDLESTDAEVFKEYVEKG